ncbi:sodium channel and clathrin linker 1 isoform 3-T3 [Dama dama]
MATEIDFLRDQNQRLNETLRRYQTENILKYSTIQKGVFKGDGDDTLENSAADQSFLVPLITEHDKHLEELNGQLKYYQKQMGEMKLQFENVIKENERLRNEFKDAVVEKQLEALPFGTEMGNEIYTDDETVRNLQEQLKLANQEKARAVELWQTASQEFYNLQKLYQEHMTEAQIHVLESQKQKDKLTSFQQLTKHLHVTNENVEMTNQHFLKTVTEQSAEIEQLRKQLRQAKLDLRVAAAKVEELTKVTEDLQGQMQKKEEDIVSAQGREEASDRRLLQLQSSVKQLETRLSVAINEATQLRAERTHLEKQTRALQAKCSELEAEKYEAIVRARNSMQLLEDANLQRNKALLEDKQKQEEIEKMKETVSQIVQDAAIRTKKVQCAEKQDQIERAIREKKAVEEELEKIYREGRINENDYRKLEEMHQRCLVAERSKDDLQLRLKTAENKIKQLEINSSEEISRCQEMIQKLQNILESERENCGFVNEQRLKLQQENEELQKQTEDLRKSALEVQKKAKLKISTMEHEFSIKEHGFEVQLREMEDSNRNSTVELRHLLATTQKAANRWKEETKKLTESAEIRISNLKSELSRQKLHTQELLSQLEMANEKVVEHEKLILEHQEKSNRLQRRLSEAEQRAASASQQLSAITVQRRKAASMMNLENM